MTTLSYLDDTWLDQERTRLTGLQQRLETAATLLVALADHGPEVAERLNALDQRETQLQAALTAQVTRHRQDLRKEGDAARTALDSHLHRMIEDLGQLSEVGMLLEAKQGVLELRTRLQEFETLLAEIGTDFSQQLRQQGQARRILEQQAEHLTEELDHLEVQTRAYPQAWQETTELAVQEEAAARTAAVLKLKSKIEDATAQREGLVTLINSCRADLDAVQGLQDTHQTQQEALSDDLLQVSAQVDGTLELLADLRRTLDEQRQVALAQQEHGARLEERVSALPAETAALFETHTVPLQTAQSLLEHSVATTIEELRRELAALREDNTGLVTRLAAEEARSELLKTELTLVLEGGLTLLHAEWQSSAETNQRLARETEARWAERHQQLSAGLGEQRRALDEVRLGLPGLLEPVEARLGILRRNVDEVDRQTRSTSQSFHAFLGWFKSAGTVARLRGSPE